MSVEIKKTKTGRTVITKDGYDEGFGSLMQGSLTGKVSLPASMAIYENDLGQNCTEWSDGCSVYTGTVAEAFGAAVRGEIPGAICYGIGKVQ